MDADDSQDRVAVPPPVKIDRLARRLMRAPRILYKCGSALQA